MLVIQLIVVPPPTQPPASIVTEPSQVLRSPWSRYSRSKASSSSRGIVGFVDERSRLEDHDGPPGLGERGRDDAAAGPRADHDHVGVERERLVRRSGGRRELERGEGDRPIGHRRVVRPVADRREVRVRAVDSGIRVRQEREQLAERPERGAALGEARPAPAEEVALARLRRHRSERLRPAGEREVDRPRLHEPQDQADLVELCRIGDLGQRVRRESRPSCGVAGHEGLGQRRERREVRLPQRGGHAPGRSQPCAGHGSQRSGRSSR